MLFHFLPSKSQSKIGFSHEIGFNYLVAEWDDNVCFMYSPGLYFRPNEANAFTIKFNLSAAGFRSDDPLVRNSLSLRDFPVMLGYHWGAGSSVNCSRDIGFHVGVGMSNYQYNRKYYDGGVFQATNENYSVNAPCFELGVNLSLANVGVYCITAGSGTQPIIGFYFRGGPFFIRDLINSNKLG